MSNKIKCGKGEPIMSKENETIEERVGRKIEKKQKAIRIAKGDEIADLVLKNANYLNVFSNEFIRADIAISDGLIVGMGDYSGKVELDLKGKLVVPGFIDSHIHLESSLVSPKEFAKAVVPHGTTTVITDPHEIANVMGTDGIDYMLQATEGLPIDVHFMLPSCVPATPLDESGATLDFKAIDRFYDNPKVLGLAEMMDFVGVINQDANDVSKILASQGHHKKIDGHAPDLSGKDLNAYITAGVYSDHECSTFENALEKLQKGQSIMIREGTAAHNLKALLPLLSERYNSRCMFATDDKHPGDLLNGGHIDFIIKESIKSGVDPIIALKAASYHAARYFLLNNKGAIAPGYLADLVVIDSIEDFNIEKVFKKGKLVFEGKTLDFDEPIIDPVLTEKAQNTFHVGKITIKDFILTNPAGVIGLINNEIITKNCGLADKVDVAKGILKIAVIERHHATHHIGLGYVSGYGLKSGAIATSVSHDSHNIIVVGCTDADMLTAVSRIIANNGGMVVVNQGKILGEVALEIAGLMSNRPLKTVNDELENVKEQAYFLGVSKGIDPLMTLSFLSLPVIPTLRITTKGIFDVMSQKFL